MFLTQFLIYLIIIIANYVCLVKIGGLFQSLLIGLRRFKSRFGTKLIIFLFLYYIYGIILV